MDNYRPISILPVLSKILEKAVNFQLQQYLKKFDLLSPAQSGFRQHHSMESAVIYFTDEIRRNVDAGRLTGVLFVDLKKAFDTIPHKELISKLERFGFVDNLITWFTNYLSNRSQVVSLGNNLSSPLGVENGVPQGSILGPVLLPTSHPSEDARMARRQQNRAAQDWVIDRKILDRASKSVTRKFVTRNRCNVDSPETLI